MLTNTQRDCLRDLAKQVKDISQDGIWQEKIECWKALNRTESVRPMVMTVITDELWPELISKREILIEEPFYRALEFDLRKKIFRWKNIRDDVVITDKIYIPVYYEFTDWVENRKRPFSMQDPYDSGRKRAECFHPCILEYKDWDRLVKTPELKFIDYKTTEINMSKAHDVFGDILSIQEGEPFSSNTDGIPSGWGLSAIDILCELRGLEQVFMDLAEAPEFIHMAMKYLCDGLGVYLDTMEREKLLRLNNNEFLNTDTPLGSNGMAFTDELPGDNFNPGHVMAHNLWGYFQAQEFSCVSPQMHDEFVIQYQKPLAERFGKIAYGCCEKNDYKYENIFKAFPNLSQVSVCHEADVHIAAETVQDRYAISWKPRCTIIDNFDEKRVREFMDKGFKAFENCHVVCSLQDNLTLHGQTVDALSGWADITMEIAESYTKA